MMLQLVPKNTIILGCFTYILSIQLCESQLCGTGATTEYNTSLITIGDGIKLGLDVSCITSEITFKLEGPFNKWFGIVFNDEMFGDCIIYTTGKSDDRESRLYDYYLSSKSIDGVLFDTQQNLIQIEETTISDRIYLEYSRLLNTNDNNDKNFDIMIDRNHPIITFRYAFGNNLKLIYHGTHSKSQDILSINLETGNISKEKDIKLMLHIMHGILMWIIWSVLAPISIFIARNKHFWIEIEAKRWFKLHRSIAIIMVSLSAVSVAFAVYSVNESQSSDHGEIPHHILGFIVNILLIFHVILAVFRPNKTRNDEQDTKCRKCWKLVHGINGLLLLILANVNIIFGVNLKGEIELIILCIVWITVIIFVLLLFEWQRSHYPLYSISNSIEKDDDNDNQIEMKNYNKPDQQLMTR